MTDGGNKVDRINQFAFYEVGKTLAKLRSFSGDVSADDVFFPLVDARSSVKELCDGNPIELVVSKVCAKTLHGRLDEVVERNFTTTDSDGAKKWNFPTPTTPPIPSWQWHQVMDALTEFETIFREEMREAATYRVPNRGIFDTAKLIDSADLTFPSDLRRYIPTKTSEDWRAAGRCLAFNLLSASGFHVARAVEGTLENYYQLATGKSKTLNGWQDYIKALESAASAPTQDLIPTEKVISGLKQMKGDYRNPIVHPRVVLSEPDARMLFANGESLITAMAQEIRSVQMNSTISPIVSALLSAE